MDKVLVNLTPHPITIVDAEGKVIQSIDPDRSRPLPRVTETTSQVGTVMLFGIVEFPILAKNFGQVQNLPEPCEGTYFVVSALVASAARREDLLVPNTVRDENGQILGCNSFSVIL